MLQNLDVFGRSMSWEVFFFFYSSQKPHSNHVFPCFNHSSIVTYVINNRWHHILSRRLNLVDLLQNINFFLNCSANSLKKTSYSCSTMPNCSNDKKSILGFSFPLNFVPNHSPQLTSAIINCNLLRKSHSESYSLKAFRCNFFVWVWDWPKDEGRFPPPSWCLKQSWREAYFGVQCRIMSPRHWATFGDIGQIQE